MTAAGRDESVPLYLTLPGAEARDITGLIEAGILDSTAMRQVQDRPPYTVVAVEYDGDAVLALQRKYPGLKILQQNLESLLRGPGDYSWPAARDRTYYRAQVVNLDLNGALTVTAEGGQLRYRELALIRKLARLHSDTPAVDWSLLLTLNATLEWPKTISRRVARFLQENFQRVETFAEYAHRLLGEKAVALVATGKPDFATLDPETKQRLILTLVPKIVMRDVYGSGWRIEVGWSYSYGGGHRARMATWCLRFRWDPAADDQPDNTYRSGLEGSLRNCGEIAANGEFVALT